jgi:hypothetical protein
MKVVFGIASVIYYKMEQEEYEGIGCDYDWDMEEDGIFLFPIGKQLD